MVRAPLRGMRRAHPRTGRREPQAARPLWRDGAQQALLGRTRSQPECPVQGNRSRQHGLTRECWSLGDALALPGS
eukprot:scaffold236872_cov33-Tisochrysis_lutea.AAC.1